MAESLAALFIAQLKGNYARPTKPLILSRKIALCASIACSGLLLGSCTFDGDTATTLVVNPSISDAAPAPQDSDAAVDAGRDITAAKHLLLTEVKAAIAGTEFIEIYNPSSRVIALGDYYLSDNAAYALLPMAEEPGPNPAVGNSDFIARFPEEASIRPGQVLIIGVNSYNLGISFGVDADYQIGKYGAGIEMRDAFPSSIGSQISITDEGEGITLFYWDGSSDLVTDVDLINAGDMVSATNPLANKTGLSIDGPDADSAESSYQDDLLTMGFFLDRAAGNQSYARNAPETGHEQHNGTGNGRFGHDETSEDIGATWVIIEQATPGQVPTSL